MLAARISEYDAAPHLVQMPEPTWREGAALVRVHAAPINAFDLHVATGKFVTGAPELPYIPGMEGAGVVVESSRFPAGTEVWFDTDAGYGTGGSLAQFVSVRDDALYALPDGVSPEIAVAIGNSGLTGWLALRKAGLQEGDALLVLGATGSSGRFAVQAGRLMGAAVIVAVGRNQARLQDLLTQGASRSIRLIGEETVEELAQSFRLAAGRPIDVTFDALWGIPGLGALEASAVGGRVVQVGDMAGPSADIPSRLLRGRVLSIIGYANRQVSFRERAEAFTNLLGHAARNQLAVSHVTYPMERLTDAWKHVRLEGSDRVVVDLSSES